MKDSLTSRYALGVDVRQGMVYLRGQVPSYEDAEHASALLGNLAGVVDVVDDTTVAPTAEE
jgi:osmotically-inducible protein OsmY